MTQHDALLPRAEMAQKHTDRLARRFATIALACLADPARVKALDAAVAIHNLIDLITSDQSNSFTPFGFEWYGNIVTAIERARTVAFPADEKDQVAQSLIAALQAVDRGEPVDEPLHSQVTLFLRTFASALTLIRTEMMLAG